ncbi:MAG: valine--tRNA ligase [bacterium]
MIELEKDYDPRKVEDKWLARWLENRAYHSDAGSGGKPYTIVIPPPNVTGILHMGHALNNTIQDILVRRRRMQGFNTVWLPGTDHAGIATQNVVERSLATEKKTRNDLGREAFIGRVWEWKEQYGGTIINQLKKLGASCDWERERFTMDPGLSDAVTEAFVHLYGKGLIYRGSRIINWCPRCQTALSDEESEHRDSAGKLYHIRYPVKGGATGEYVVVATTRPETMLGDTAVAVSPDDPRYKDLVGKTLILPILNREIQVVADSFVDPAFGTGAVKVTPAHDPNDFEMASRHGLKHINILTPDAKMNAEAGPYAGLDRFACRKQLVADLEAAGLLEKIADHNHAVGHCYRCNTVVEPRLSPQWFVKMKPLAAPAIEAVKQEKIVFVPDRWTKVYLDWMENIRDWCISRQIWWGHRIPVFYCSACNHEWAAKGAPSRCPKCGDAGIRQDEDVLDTWFSSWLWPFSTFGWPEKSKDLSFYYPTDDLVTASEIIFFWVARMIMAGYEFMGDLPFRRVYIHGTVRDDKGRKMSKSLGNSIDPLAIINEFSADALRFSLTMLTATGQDVYVSNEKFTLGRNFGTKLWNAARYLQMQTKDSPAMVSAGIPSAEGLAVLLRDGIALSPDDQHILYLLRDAIAACDDNLDKCRFNDAAHVLYEFVWHQFCDWYVEYSKSVLYEAQQDRREHVLRVMHFVFSNVLRLLHPFMPFMTEELWLAMGYGVEGGTISAAPWPTLPDNATLAGYGVNKATVAYVDDKYDLIRVGRALRSDYTIQPSRKIAYIVKPVSPQCADALRADMESVLQLLRAEKVDIVPEFQPAKAMPSGVNKLGTIFMPLDGLIDVQAETARLTRQREKVEAELAKVDAKLANQAFMSKAPKDVVAQLQQRRSEVLEQVGKYDRQIQALV